MADPILRFNIFIFQLTLADNAYSQFYGISDCESKLRIWQFQMTDSFWLKNINYEIRHSF